jgi:hypothetical protein
MRTFFRDIFIVSYYDLIDSYYSRRALVWITLFLLMSIIASSLFIYSITKVETELSKVMSIPRGSSPGALSTSLWESETFLRLMTDLVGDKTLVNSLMKTPPIALFFGWFILATSPMLVILLSSESVSADVSTGAVRYLLFRTSRLAWVIGKATGQAVLLLIALFLGSVCIWGMAYFWMDQFQPLLTAYHLLIQVVKTWSYSLAFLGMAFAVSQSIKSVQLSRSIGILLYIGIAILSKIADHYSGDGAARLWELAYLLTPQAHKLKLWHTDPATVGSAILFSLGLGCLYFIFGYLILSRKDL